jgi:gag-polypeptide of LTR copia-type
MKEKETLKEYFSKVIELVNQIKSFGENLNDKSVYEKILISLSPKYNNIAAIIEEIQDLSTLNVHDLMGFLEMHEQSLSRHNDHSFESAFQSKVNVKESENHSMTKRDTSRGGFNGGRGRSNFGRGGGRSDNQRGDIKIYNFCKKSGHTENFYRNKRKAQCYHCKKYGHMEKFCRLKNKKQTNYTDEQRDDESEKRNDGSTFYARQSTVEKKDDVWYVDNGCSNHMTGDESIFCKLDTTATTQITMDNGAVVILQQQQSL